MKRTTGKLITLLLCLTMILSLMPVTALAATPNLGELGSVDSITSIPGVDSDSIGDIIDEIGKLPSVGATPAPSDPTGDCGVSMHWHLSLSTGVLTISGNGAMYNWTGSEHAPWYANRGSIKTVVIENSIPSIGAYAFDGLSNLTAVELPETLEIIGAYAFTGCSKLPEIDLPDSLTAIGSGAFEGCAALTSVTMPANIHKASESLFKGCTALKTVTFPVGETELGSNAFEGCTALETVVWNELTKIGSGTFRGCTKMTTFNFPDTLTEIGKDAFSGSGLKQVKLPKGISDIAFLGGADELTTVFIPKSVKDIEAGQFAGCKNLKQVDYEGSKLDWKNIRIGDNNDMLQNVEFTYNRTENFLYAEAVTVTPEPTTAPTPVITPAPTAKPTPTPVATPAPDVSLEPGWVNVPGLLTGGYNADTNTYTINGFGKVNSDYGLEMKSVNDDWGGTTIEYMEFGGNVIIGDDFFTDYADLKTLTIKADIAFIGQRAFAGCENLSEITLPETLEKICNGAFSGCTNLETVHFNGTEEDWNKYVAIGKDNEALTSATITFGNQPRSTVEHAYKNGLCIHCGATEATPAPTAQPTPVVTPAPDLPGGECGDHAEWSFDESTGTLTIYGEGEMVEFFDTADNNAPWYDYRNKITSVVVEPGITSLSFCSFYNLQRLKTVSLPEGLTKIGTSAFNNCQALEYITIPGTVTELGNAAFSDCASLKGIQIPDSVTKMGEMVFFNCTALESVVLSKNITELPFSAFHTCTSLTDVRMHEGLKTIGDSAFANCSALKSIDIPDSVTDISFYAFATCMVLEDMIIPRGVTVLSRGIFSNCHELKAVQLPKSIIEIEQEAFLNCHALSDVYYEGSEADWNDIIIAKSNMDGSANILLSDKVTIHYNSYKGSQIVTPTAQPTPVVTPAPDLPGGECGKNAKWSFDESTGTLTIYGEGETENWGSAENTPWYSYRGKTKTIVIQNGITHIGTSAFRNFQNLTKISLPESLESIGGSVFFDCVRLSTIDIPESVSQIGAQAFYGCELLTEVTIPAKVTVLESWLFTECTALTKVNLPEGLTEIGSHAFHGCDKLTSVNLPSTLKKIEHDAFNSCAALSELKIPSGISEIEYNAFNECDGLQYISVPEGVETINFLTWCNGQKAVYLPKSIVEINSTQFNNCSELTDVYYGGSESDWKDIIINDHNESLLNATFHYNASGLPDDLVATTPTPVVTPAPTVKPVTTPNPNMPNGKCGENATWEFNTSDGTLTIRGEGKMVNGYKTEAGTVVGYGWNKYQSVIKKVVIEEGITHISDNAFKECTGLKEVVMPESVTSIGDMVFWGTWNVEKFTIHPTLAETYYNSVPPYIENLYIYDLEHFLGLYQGKTSAGEYTGNFFTDAKNIYLNDVLLTDLVIPEGFTSVPDSAFSGCNSLKTVTLPDTVTTIGEKAFFECDNLKDVKLSENLKEIEQQAFDSCKSLTSITIPASVEIINERVFSNVKSIAFEGNAPLIAANAFMQVKADAYYPAGDSTWTAEKKENYGGELNWIEGTPTVEPTTTPEPTPVVTPEVTPEVTPSVEPTTTPEVTPTVKPTVTPTPTPYVPVEPTVNPELDPATCKHTLFFVAPQDATCTEEGFTGKVVCGKGCGTVLQEGRVKPALGHKYKNGSCTRCGHIEGTPEPTPTPPVAEGTPFIDMTVNDWFYEPVRWAVENGITGGTSENTFSPNMTCTRAQIVTFLWAAAGKPEPTSESPFSDVKEGDWFYEPVIWAVENDITSGTTATTFSPNIPCSRAQVVALLYKALNSPAVNNAENPFTDVLESNYFHKAVLWALENGVASGMTETLFGSSRPCTRAQIATFLYKAYNK